MDRNDVRQGRVAVLADLHGNLIALDAVLAEIDRLGVRRIVVAGDIAWGPQPAETIERVMALDQTMTVVRGNADREVVDPATVDGDAFLQESTVWCSAQLSRAQRSWLGKLPKVATVAIDGLGAVLVCHGSPRSDTEGIRPDTAAELVEGWLSATPEPIVICGHTHVQFDRTVGRYWIVNPGSVGLHYGVEGAQWALIGTDGVELRTTPYEIDRAARLARDSGIPGAEEFARFFLDPTAE